MRPFAVVASQRTGSTLLVRSLDASPRIFCAGEIFHSGGNIFHGEYRYSEPLLGSRRLGRLFDVASAGWRIRRHLEIFFARAGTGVEAAGFKLMTSHIRASSSILSSLVKHGVTLLFLHRRDSFATALSYYKAKSSGVYHSDRTAESGATRIVTADLVRFGAQLAHCERDKLALRDMHSALGGTLLAYEDMVADWNGFIENVGRAIGVDRLKIPAALEKLETTHRVIIENEDALRREFAPRVTP